MRRLCVFVIIACVHSIDVSQVSREDILRYFIENELVPFMLPVAPAQYMTVQFPSGAAADQGNVLTPTQVKNIPFVSWNASDNTFYTVLEIDRDAPSREKPSDREWLHWLVVNVRGIDIETGETIAEYVGAGPSQNSSLHRYVLLVYKQPYKLEFDEPRLTNRSPANRTKFSTYKFATKYKMGNPIAGNFYQAEYDDYVPILYQQLFGGQSSRATFCSSMTVLTSIVMIILALIK